ncbi:type VII secretion-associated serine protease mycosin [Dactylosporangium sp. NPDC051485]|uniref:type VII secretion-associated serine protease mycosin n=1 Tax=Dactylosporangium sp. NPDC051485 TaxID=3154846 RepID=UPI00341E2FAC
MILRRLALTAAAATLAMAVFPTPAQADTARDQQWHLGFLHMAEAQQVSQGEGVMVAVLDSGVDASVPELAAAVVPGKDFGGGKGDGRSDTNGHGTAMAALIAGRGKGGDKGVLGIAPKSTILPVQVAQYIDFAGYPEDVAAGIDYAVSRGASVICIAAGTNDVSVLRSSIQKAFDADVVVVAAAGNKPKAGSVVFPAKMPGVVAVGAIDQQGQRAAVSVAGPELSLVAPGVDIASTGLSGKLRTGTGTSDAAAIVAGVVALVRAKYPQMRADEVVHRLTATAQDKDEPGRDPVYGYGIVDPVKALTADVPPASPSTSPQASAAPSSAGKAGGGNAAGVIAAISAAAVVVVFIAVLQIIIRGRRRRT